MIKLTITVLVILCLGGVTPGLADSQKGISEADTPFVFQSVFVMPFQNMVRIHGANHTVRGPVTRKAFITGEVAPEAERIMDKELHRLLVLDRSIKWQISSPDAYADMPDRAHGPTLIKKLQQIGDKNQADAILVSYLYAYRERQGGDFGADSPAQVAFEMALILTDSGATVWRKGFSETQKALNENLLEIGKFIKRKGRWITAQSMGKQAMQEMFRTFPRPHQLRTD